MQFYDDGDCNIRLDAWPRLRHARRVLNHWRVVARLSVAHLVNDLDQAAVTAVLPFLVARGALSYTAASGLVVAATLSAAIVQPVLGHRADRRASRSIAAISLVVSGAGVAALGLAGATGASLAIALAIGAATAAFHPDALRMLAEASPGTDRRATALAAFSVLGNLGTAIGPMLVAALVTTLGMPGLALAALPALAAAGLVMARAPGPGRGALPRRAAPGPTHWRGVARMVALLVLRSAVASYATAFVPLVLVRERGFTVAHAGMVITAMLLAGVAWAPVAAWLADRFGARSVLIGSFAPVGPLLWLVPHGSPALVVTGLLVVGAGTLAPYSVAIAAAQACAPGREGLAAGIAMGIGSVGALALVPFGVLADASGVAATLPIAGALPVIATLCAARRFARAVS